MKTLLSISALACALAFGFMSCEKEKEEEPLILSDNKAVVQSKTIVPNDEPIFFNIGDNEEIDDETKADISLAGSMSLDLQLANADKYRLGYFDSDIETIEDIKIAVLDTATIKYTSKLTMSMVDGPAPSTPNAWYNYLFTSHTLATIEGRYVILFEGNEETGFSNTLDKVFIVQLTDIL